MSDPRKQNLPWPFVAVDEPGFFGVEIAPNEIVYVVLAGDYRTLATKHEILKVEHDHLQAAAAEQIKSARELIDVWQHFGKTQL